MKHPRKRDWPQLVYKYWARPTGPMPARYFEQLTRQDQAWNAAVQCRNGILDQTKDIVDKKERRPYWENFFGRIIEIFKNHDLGWEAHAEYLERFMTAHSEAMKKGLKLHERDPNARKKLLCVHRFSQGGLPTEEVHSARAWRLFLEPLDPLRFADNSKANRRQRNIRGRFGFAKDVSIEFTMHLSRPLPQGAFIKKAYWVGRCDHVPPPHIAKKSRKISSDGWEYSLQLVLEVPPVDHQRTDSAVAGIDLGWRIREERSYIRIATIVDSGGRAYEIRLPLNRPDSHAKKGLKKHIHDSPVYDSYMRLTDLQSLMGNSLEVLKLTLQDKLHEDWLGGIEKMREGGLLRLLATMRKENYDGPGKQDLEEWAEENGRRSWALYRQLRRLTLYRRRTYWSICKWLAENYRVISWEKDLDLKKMAENAHDSPIFTNSAKYRQWSGLSEFRAMLPHSAGKFGSYLYGDETRGSTLCCSFCNAEIAFSSLSGGQRKSDLVLECPNGHRLDQDLNASTNFLYSGLAYLRELNLTPDRSIAPTIPEYLKENIVPIEYAWRNATDEVQEIAS